MEVKLILLCSGSAHWLVHCVFRDILHLLDIICCCLTLLPIVWSIRHLRQAATEDTKDGRGAWHSLARCWPLVGCDCLTHRVPLRLAAARSMDRLKSFRTFYLLVVSYVYFTRIIVFLLGSVLPFEFTWISNVFSEIAALTFYTVTGCVVGLPACLCSLCGGLRLRLLCAQVAVPSDGPATRLPAAGLCGR